MRCLRLMPATWSAPSANLEVEVVEGEEETRAGIEITEEGAG